MIPLPWLILAGAALLLLSRTEAAADTLDELTDTMTNLDQALLHHNVRAFLAMIRAAEGTADADGYHRLFGGGRFESFADHPRLKITRTVRGSALTSSAAGAYQFIVRTWDEARAGAGLTDFAPPSQDLAAAWLIRRRGALGDVIDGRFADAVRKCRKEWASLPDAGYNQPERTLAQVKIAYERAGGRYA